MSYFFYYGFRAKILILLLLFFPASFYAQEKNQGVDIHVEKTLKRSQAQNIISTAVQIQNRTAQEFSGYIDIPPVKGLRNISRSIIPINVPATDSLFIPVKFLVQSDLQAGTIPVTFSLLDAERAELKKIETSFTMEERTNLILNVDDHNLFITSLNDSIRVKATVFNSGNKAQNVTLVFSIPTLQGGTNFTEQKVLIEPMKQHQFILSFLPNKNLLEQLQFSVNISAMRGTSKEIFGSSIVQIHNILTNRNFSSENTFGSDQFLSSSQNSISASYRAMGSSSSSLQLRGTGSVDLPAGYLELSGNIYKANTDNLLIATNTFAKYKYNDNELTVGNIYESLESTISGRGSKLLLADGKHKQLQVGVVDENYNLFSDKPLFDQGYSAYAVGTLKDYHHLKNISSVFIHQYDPREKSLNNIVSGETNLIFNKWTVGLKVHGATSKVDNLDQNKLSGASELTYRGKINRFDISGLYYLSSDYFPGNCRGMFYIQQSVYKGFSNNYSIRANLLYSAFSPKSFVLTRNYKSNYFTGDVEFFTPRIQNVYLSMGYQARNEISDSYKQNNFQKTRLDSHRLKESIRWNISGSKHSIYLVQDNGFAKYPSVDKLGFQSKTSLTYSYDWLNFVGTYQSGSYYLSEFYLSQSEKKSFRRLILSTMANKDFSDGKYVASAGVSLMNDPFSRMSLSAYSNFRYALSRTSSIYMNGTWNHYQLSDTGTNSVYSIEVGFTLNLPSRKLSTKRKSKISTFVFYDHNSNGFFDSGDKEAVNYNVKINNIAFRSAENGMITYKGVPYGKYQVGQVSENGWFFDGDTIIANRREVIASVPLRQAGTVVGSIHYKYDVKSAVEIVPQLVGVIFKVKNTSNELLHRVVTDSEGNFTTFLPTGNYILELDEASLPEGAFCNNPTRSISIVSGKILNLKSFEIGVKAKKVNMKYFSQ